MSRYPILWRGLLLAALFVLAIIPPHRAKAQSICAPGAKCSFSLASVGTACRTNENVFFTQSDRWVIPANSYDYFNFRFGPYNTGGYVIAGKYWGGCLCDVATWINYVLKINGYNTDASAKYHTAYDIADVPDEYEPNGDHKYFVSLEYEDNNAKPPPDANGNPVKWDADMRVDNHLGTDLVIHWQIIGDNVEIWLENSTSTSVSSVEFPVVEEIEQVSSPVLQAPVTNESNKNKWELFLKLVFFGTLLFFVLGMIFSKPFRDGAIPVVLCTVLVLFVVFLLWPFIMP